MEKTRNRPSMWGLVCALPWLLAMDTTCSPDQPMVINLELVVIKAVLSPDTLFELFNIG